MTNTNQPIRTLIAIALIAIITVSLTSQPAPVQAAGTCSLTVGQVVVNEISPKVTDGMDWIELYNTTGSTLDLSYCVIDDIPGGGSAPFQIAAGETIPAHGFWTIDKASYFNNGGDDVRLLLDDAATILDTYTYTEPNYDYSWYRSPDGGAWAAVATSAPTKGASNTGSGGTCGTGTWIAGNLEVHHINIGQGDSTLIVGPTGKSLLFDAGEENWNSSAKAQIIGPYIQTVLGCKSLDYVVISHFHLDHIGYVDYGGLWHLIEVQGFTVAKTLLRNYNAYLGNTSGTFDNWKTYLAGAGQAKLNPVTAVEGTSQVDLGAGVTFDILTVDGNGAIIPGDFSADTTPPSENDYSIGVLLSYGAFDEWIGGDLDGEYSVSGFGYTYHDIELSAAPEVGDVDVYKVNHHASQHSSNVTFVNQLDPEISVLTVGDGNTYGHPTQPVMDLLLATSTVYMTERGEPTTDIGSAIIAGDIVIKTSNGTNYTVNGTPYVATEPVRTDADGDGYFVEVDPADNNSGSTPAPNGGCDSIYQICFVTKTLNLRSQGLNDGWVLESAENSAQGGSKNAAATTFYLGDNAQDKQYRAILSFNTAGLPDNAVVTKVTLKIKKQGLVGTNPFNTHTGLKIDIRKLKFGSLPGLQLADFQTLANRNAIGTFGKLPVNTWYSATLANAAFPFVNLTGLTQFRLRFVKDDNDDMSADYLKFFSGNATLTYRPLLVIEYHIP